MDSYDLIYVLTKKVILKTVATAWFYSLTFL